ncbi:MAG: YeeE/YedE family protein [Planctomycetes bacterium]|nr:YeeE/YedE family protein [Planctomycetota bacterium]
MFDPPAKLALGLFTGVLFGILLQKGRAAKFHVILGQFLLRDWTVVKIMGTAVAVGAIGVYLLAGLGLASLHIKPFLIGGVILGGALFGCGMAILGYCPGTSVAACGEGSRDAMVGVVGMLAGALAYVALYPGLQPIMESLGDWGEITLPDLFAGTSPWFWIAILVGAGTLLLLINTVKASGPRPANSGIHKEPADVNDSRNSADGRNRRAFVPDR